MPESSQDLLYYREYLQDFAAPRTILNPPAVVVSAYRESNSDLTYYRTYFERS